MTIDQMNAAIDAAYDEWNRSRSHTDFREFIKARLAPLCDDIDCPANWQELRAYLELEISSSDDEQYRRVYAEMDRIHPPKAEAKPERPPMLLARLGPAFVWWAWDEDGWSTLPGNHTHGFARVIPSVRIKDVDRERSDAAALAQYDADLRGEK